MLTTFRSRPSSKKPIREVGYRFYNFGAKLVTFHQQISKLERFILSFVSFALHGVGPTKIGRNFRNC